MSGKNRMYENITTAVIAQIRYIKANTITAVNLEGRNHKAIFIHHLLFLSALPLPP